MNTIKLHTWLYTVTLAFLCVVLLATGIALYSHTATAVSDVLSSTDETTLHIAVSHVDSVLSDVYRLCTYMRGNQAMLSNIRTVTSDGGDLYERVLAASKIRSYLSTLRKNNDIVSLIVIETDRQRYQNGSVTTGRNQAFDMTFESAEEITLHLPAQEQSLSQVKAKAISDMIYYSFQLMDGETCIARVCVALDNAGVASLFDERRDLVILGADQQPLVYDADVWQTVQPLYATLAQTGQPVRQSNASLYAASTDNGELTVLYYHSRETYRYFIHRILLDLLLACLVAALLFGVLSVPLHDQISRPMTDLIRELKRFPDTIKLQDHQLKGRFSLREKLFLRLILSVIIPAFGFLLVFTGLTQDLMRQVYARSYEAATLQIATATEKTLHQKLKSLTHVAVDPLMLSLPSLDESKLKTPVQRENWDELDEIVRENAYLGLDADRLELFYPDGRLFFSNSLISGDLPPTYFEQNAPLMWYREIDSGGVDRMCYYQELMSVATSDTIGYGKLSVSSLQLEHMILQINSRLVSFYVTESDGTPVFGFDHHESRGDSSAAVTVALPSTAWQISAQYEMSPLYENLLALYALYVLFLILAFFVLSFPLSRSIGRISLAMSSLQIGDVESFLQENFRIDEYNDIAAHFNRMAVQIEALIDEILISNQTRAQIEAQKNHAEITALQAQIHPHFLSNTIGMIIMTMQDGEILQASEMLHDMDQLFRYGISKTNAEITVREELLHAKAYANIMQKRYSEVLFRWDIAEEVANCRVIKLILQPVLENAIYHGIRKSSTKGEICVKSYLTEDTLVFLVTDTGAGMTPERLQEVRGFLTDAMKSDRIGICNVDKRIKLTYGERYGISVESTLGRGTRITLRLPIRR